MPTFPHFCAYCWVILMFKMVPKCSVEVLSGIPKCKKKIWALHNLKALIIVLSTESSMFTHIK